MRKFCGKFAEISVDFLVTFLCRPSESLSRYFFVALNFKAFGPCGTFCPSQPQINFGEVGELGLTERFHCDQ